MPQDFDLKIAGESVPVESAELLMTFDTPGDGFSAKILVDRKTNADLYNKIKPYQATPVKINLEGTLKLTGKLTNPKRNKSGTGTITNIIGFSDTFNFIDSHLVPPYEFFWYDLNGLTERVAKQTATTVIPATDPGGKFSRAVATAGQSAYDFLGPYAVQRSLVMSNTVKGELILQQANINQGTVGTIEEDAPGSLLQKEFSGEWDLRERFKTYKVKTSSPFGRSQAIATDKNIKLPRHKLVSADNLIKGEASEIAEYVKNIALVDNLNQELPVVGWEAPDGSMFEPGTLITLKSETLFVPDGFTYFIRAVKYISKKNEKTAILSLIPKEVYTGDAIVEPWFAGVFGGLLI